MMSSERSLRSLLESVLQGEEDLMSVLPLAVALLQIRPTLRLRYVSPQFEQMTGYSPETVLGDLALSPTSVVPQEDLPPIRSRFRELRRNGDRFSAEFRMRCADGTVRWFSCEAVARTSPPRELYALLTLTDVTSRKSVELALDAERLEHRSLIEALPAVVYEMTMTAEEQRLTYVSPQIETLTGYAPEELLDDPTAPARIVHPRDLERVVEALRATWRTGSNGESLYRVVRKDGTAAWVRNRWSVVASSTPGTVKIRGIVGDVSEQKTAEARAEETLRLYRTLIEHIPGFVFVVRLTRGQSRLVYLSPQAESFFQRPMEEFPSKLAAWAELVHEEDIPPVITELKRVYRTRSNSSLDVRFRMPNGSLKWTNIQASVISDSEEDVIDLLGVGHDVTPEREAVERASRQRELETQLMRADRLAAVGQLAAGIAHEVNNALASLLPYGSLLSLDPTLPEIAREHGRKIEEQAHRIAAIVRGLLNLARQQLPKKARWPLGELVRDTLTLVGAEAKRADISVISDIPVDVTVVGDRGQLQQVILNLLSNAIQAMADQPVRRLEISATATVEEVRLCVVDTGPGIPAEIRERLFTGFVTTRAHGSGLGLSISASILKAHGGEISLDDSVSTGACFVLRLPSTSDGEEARPAGAPAPLPINGQRIRALVVDDEVGVRMGFAKLLEHHGVAVEVVGDGRSALRQLEQRSYDVIFLDLRMPGMSGIDVYERLRQWNTAQAERVVVMTADAASLEVRVFLDSVRLPVLLKPFDIGTVRELIARATQAGGDVEA